MTDDRRYSRGRRALDRSSPRFMDIPTFMRAPIVQDWSDFDVAIIGVPYDGAVTNRPGARHGPREVRSASSLTRAIHPVTRINPFEACRVGDGGDVPFTTMYDVADAHAEIEAYFREVRGGGVRPLAVGGDHSITLPILRALVGDRPVGLIQVDAHTDTWDEFMGSKWNHGAPFRRAIEEGLIDPRRSVQIGIRGAQNTTEGWDFAEEHGMRVFWMSEVSEIGIDAVISETRSIVGDEPTYLSFDIDGLDPAFAPGTGTPEFGGLTSVEALALLRGLAPLSLVGADVVEVAPPFDVSGITALAGATVAYELLCLMSPGCGA